jgi:hypothetical protein
MDMVLLREVEDKSKMLKIQTAQVHEDMLSFCRVSNDPVAQDIASRLDTINSKWDDLSLDIAKLQLMYDESRGTS